uniref:Uncharacterized LOC114462934 n=1 Tax=Gouania willdenowi TaxID=441366 RepID=A0A8C5HCD2_GOUWI
MSVQLEGEEEDVIVLGALVNEAWRPLVSEHCAYRVASPSPKLSFFIPYNAPCITHEDNLQLQLVLDDQDYLLSCPITSSPQFASYPSPPSSPLFPGEPQFIKSPVPTDASSTTPPSPPPILTQAAHLPDYLHYPDPGHELSQVNPLSLLHPLTHVGLKKHHDEKDFLYPKDSSKYLPYPNHLSVMVQTSSASNLNPTHARSWHQNIPDGHFQSSFDQYHQYMPFFYPVSTPAPTTTIMTTVSPATQPPKPPAGVFYHPYYVNAPHYPETTAAPVTQTRTPLLPTPLSLLPLKQPSSQHYRHSLSHPHVSLGSLYSYWADSQQKPLASHPGSLPTPSPTASNSDIYGYPFYLPDPPAKGKPPSPVAMYRTCLPYTQTICGYHYYPHYFYYGPNPSLYHNVPQFTSYYSPTTTQMPTTATPPASIYQTPASPFPHMQCLNGRMLAFLPFAHPDSIQVKDQIQGWVFLSTVSPLCGYVVKGTDEAGVAFYSPLPGCHSQSQAPMTISLAVRFWDLSTAQYRTVDLQCPYQSTPEASVPVYPSVPTPQTTTKDKKVQSVVPKIEVYCSSHQMIVELPPGSISGIEVKDVTGNQMKLQEAPKYCGYSASKGKDGKIHLSFQLHSRCHMSVQGKMHIIGVIYITENGRKEAKFSCPVFTPESGQECNLPTEQRLPCGSGSVSPPQCLSLGCCFNKHPPACYYPMDECTVDRHFVFSVPADLTEPALKPDLLVAASNFSCKPEKVTADYALFKVPMDGCGTHRVVVGKMVVYMLEVINKVQTISLNYGTITRDSPVRSEHTVNVTVSNHSYMRMSVPFKLTFL